MDTERDFERILHALRSGYVSPAQFLRATSDHLKRGAEGLSDLASDLGIDKTDPESLTEVSPHHATGPGADVTEPRIDRTTVVVEETPLWRPTSAGLVPPLPINGASRYDLAPERHARGGLGEVWRATDRHLGREVALKRLRPDRLGRGALHFRFQREAQITARLQHPGIVPLFDLMLEGPEGGGGPWYTMRFVSGKTLAEALVNHHNQVPDAPDLRRLVEALVAVCQTIAYAHAHGVLHRDLKGDNIIIGDFGEVFVLDWGLAKAGVSDDPDDPEGHPLHTETPPSDGPQLTEPGAKVGTPAYMAPEVVRGRPATKASDVYALGAVLYSVLTGRPPYQGPTPESIVHRIEEGAPEAPHAVRPRVPRALEAICRKAMSRQAESRYASATDLAEDLRRWLADQPVTAYRDPWTVRLTRWGRKHRTTAAAGLVFLATAALSMASASGLLARAYAETATARDEAADRYRLAREVVGKMLDHVVEHDLPNAVEVVALRRDLAQTSVELHRALARQRPGDRELARDTAVVEFQAGNVHRALYETDVAARLYDQAAERLRTLLDERADDDRARLELARVLLERADLEVLRGEPTRATVPLDEADRLIDQVMGQGDPDAAWLVQAGRARLSRGVVLEALGQPADALAESLKALQYLAGPATHNGHAALLHVIAQGNQACHAHRLSGPESARPIALSNASQTAALLAVNQDDGNVQYLHARNLHTLGRVLLDSADEAQAEAEAALTAAQTLLEGLAARTKQLPRYVQALAEVERDLARVPGREAARANLAASVASFRELAKRYPDIRAFQAGLGLSLAAQAQADGDASVRAEAKALLESAEKRCPGDPDVRAALKGLAGTEG